MRTVIELYTKLKELNDEEHTLRSHREIMSVRRIQRGIVHEFVRDNPGVLQGLRKPMTQVELSMLITGRPLNSTISFIEHGNTSTMNTRTLLQVVEWYTRKECGPLLQRSAV